MAAALLLLAACAPSRREEPPPVPKPNVDPARTPRAPVRVPPTPPPLPSEPPPERIAPPEAAAANDWMPLASTGAARFRQEHPSSDGRGVLIAILDTGIDPAVPGFGTTTGGQPKLADLRDFSGEGAVALHPVNPVGDTVQVGSRRLGGVGRVRALVAAGPWYGGTVAELPLGVAPAADLNGNGVVGDTLPLLVARATDGWVVFPDRDGDGSLAGERPVADYLRGRDWFGWSSGGRTPPVGVAVNLEERDGEPRLGLVFDLDSHGTHVAGIAAGNDIYGAAALDGTAPGAQLLGLKIANAGQGSVSTNGAIVRALDYAIAFAAARRQPLVVNLSFGVGNEREGGATIDRLVDSALRRHPEVVLTVSAGNDGPGLSTLGFPGSARRAITVGATISRGFLPPPAAGGDVAEPIAFFSARGGEVAKPDIVAPGVAYSTVPRWDAGDEVKQGTSMAAPQVAGLAALLLSALREEGRSADGPAIRRALMVTAAPVAGAGLVEGGRGVPDVGAAYEWLRRGPVGPRIEVHGPGGGDAALLTLEPGGSPAPVEFALRADSAGPRSFRLRSDAPWLRAPASVELRGASTVRVAVDASVLSAPGVAAGVVSGWGDDSLAGPAFRLPVTLVRPAALLGVRTALRTGERVSAGGTLRSPFLADSARGFEVRVNAGATDQAFAFLHEPGGRPYRNGGMLPLVGGQPAILRVNGEDARAGVWEVVVSASPAGAATASVEVLRSPLAARLVRTGERTVSARVSNPGTAPVRAGIAAALVGAELIRGVAAPGPEGRELAVIAPGWARQLVVEVTMTPEQWGRFTDFGVTVFDSIGRRLEAEPMQYATGRLTLPLTPGADRALRLSLRPGLADPADSAEWRAGVTVRAFAPRELALAPAAGDSVLSVAGAASAALEFPLPPSPWPLPAGYHPLAGVTVTTPEGRWTLRDGLALPLRNTMR